MTTDFFRARLQEMVDPRHPLVVLAGRMPWETLEAALAPNFARPSRGGRSKLEEDLLGPPDFDSYRGKHLIFKHPV